ncbi:hypothetical protein BDE02_10G148300 [Populus trichocarpa]|nr:hypothetical protein BDE02_10G148300 [Populus trichocarpa]
MRCMYLSEWVQSSSSHLFCGYLIMTVNILCYQRNKICFPIGKNSELSSSGQESGMNGILDELNGTASLRLQLAGQYPYLPGPYNLNLLNDTKFQPAAEMNIQKGPGDFNVSGSFEAPKLEYDSGPHGWASTPGSCAVTMFDDHLYAPQPH